MELYVGGIPSRDWTSEPLYAPAPDAKPNTCTCEPRHEISWANDHDKEISYDILICEF